MRKVGALVLLPLALVGMVLMAVGVSLHSVWAVVAADKATRQKVRFQSAVDTALKAVMKEMK